VVRTLVTQSRSASFMESLSVREPDSTEMTFAPSMRMRPTLGACRATSTAPMYTSHGNPIIAAAVAVATPCWPAPVSAMMRCLPSFLASNT
jgi:hypothetical protein